MKKIIFYIIAVLILITPEVFLARTRYRDMPADVWYAPAVNFFLENNYLDQTKRTFRPGDNITRAEFIKLILLVALLPIQPDYEASLFDDVPNYAWYKDFFTVAANRLIVQGENNCFLTGAKPCLANPESNISRAEAATLITRSFSLIRNGKAPVFFDVPPNQWFFNSVQTLADNCIMQGDQTRGLLYPYKNLTRAEAVTLLFRAAEVQTRQDCPYLKQPADGNPTEQEPPNIPVSDDSSSSQESSSSKPAETETVLYDNLPASKDRPDFLLLGEISPILGDGSVTLIQEPFDINTIIVRLTGSAQSVESFFIYDVTGKQLGAAHYDSSLSGTNYTLELADSVYTGKGQVFHFYVRAKIKPYDRGGVSGETVQISRFEIMGDGHWSNERYHELSTETFRIYKTTRARFASITNADISETALFGGNQTIGAFKFTGEISDSLANLQVTDITFTVNIGGATISNPRLGTYNTDYPCTLTSSTITCSSIPETVGLFRENDETLYLTADVSPDPNSLSQRLQIFLNESGGPTSAGNITWTDGFTSFNWIQFDDPVATGTRYEN